MSKPQPPRNQAEYTIWRNAQRAAEQAAKQPKQTAAQAEVNARQEARRARDAAREERNAQERREAAERDRAENQAKWDAWYRAATGGHEDRDRYSYSRPSQRQTSQPRTKASKAADLAVSAWSIGSLEESYTAATRAGALYRKAGRSMVDMGTDAPDMQRNPDLWRCATTGHAATN